MSAWENAFVLGYLAGVVTVVGLVYILLRCGYLMLDPWR